MKPDLITDLRQRIERVRKVRQESSEQRRRAEELIQQAEQLLTRIEWSQQHRNANSKLFRLMKRPRITR